MNKKEKDPLQENKIYPLNPVHTILKHSSHRINHFKKDDVIIYFIIL